MKRIYTITIEVRDDDRVDESDRFDECEYWAGQTETFIQRLQRDVAESQERGHNRLNWQAIDLTAISMKSSTEEA